MAVVTYDSIKPALLEAKRHGHLAIGVRSVRSKILSGSASLVILAEDIFSNRSETKLHGRVIAIRELSDSCGLSLVFAPSMRDLGMAIKAPKSSAIAIFDPLISRAESLHSANETPVRSSDIKRFRCGLAPGFRGLGFTGDSNVATNKEPDIEK